MKLRIVYCHLSKHYEVERKTIFGWRTQEYCYPTIEGAQRYARELRAEQHDADIGKTVIQEV